MNCVSYRVVKLLDHGMKLVERVFKRMWALVDFDNMQFGFTPG